VSGAPGPSTAGVAAEIAAVLSPGMTIELRGAIPEEFHAGIGANVFGCDICQEVCPWNSDAPVTGDPAFQPVKVAEFDELDPERFRTVFGRTPVMRAKYAGFVRNLEIVKKNT